MKSVRTICRKVSTSVFVINHVNGRSQVSACRQINAHSSKTKLTITRDRQTDRQTDRQRQKKRHRQTNRQTDRHADRHTDREVVMNHLLVLLHCNDNKKKKLKKLLKNHSRPSCHCTFSRSGRFSAVLLIAGWWERPWPSPFPFPPS